ncbi:MAG: RidA family protein [Alphaproteobacteria bacterium]|nr:RidA family protein [Alphaproteobacteria bacterium]
MELNGTGAIEAKLKQLGIVLPEAAKPVANYVPWVKTGKLVFVAGQIPLKDGKPQQLGALGAGVSVEQGAAAARLCGINLLAQLKAACDGDLDRVARVVKLVGFVNCAADFTDIPKVVNGASDLMVEVFGEAGKHARSAVGAPSLPLGVSVEVEAVVEIK